ncbi:response regulator [Paenibacillus sp. IB182496]|uniref:Response regulator n=1 Tax=Paenibacillus sabuli TaxID=2772509 RepID=A0A927BWR0_9BACL|nr:response regulator [Paenibacillus sabuli]MBD2846904.1 response regulator [Paenibacillus sabuli]
MRAILIDDEKPALQHLERLLRADGRIEVTGKFTSAKEGLAYLDANGVDLVFLDIGMPEMNGLEAGEYIQQLDGSIRIVYVTAYSEYALEAFELNALDYLLKPVLPARFAKMLDRISAYSRLREPQAQTAAAQAAESAEAVSGAAAQPQVLCFKWLALWDAGGSGDKLRWRTMKSQELFAYLLHHKGEWVSKDRMIETLWPEHPHERAVNLLHTSIYQIRKMLKEQVPAGTIEYAQSGYRLSGEIVTDDRLFESGLREEAQREQPDWSRIDRLLGLYRGEYLEDYDYAWAQSRQRELLQLYTEHMTALAHYEQRTGRLRQALQRLILVQVKDPYAEDTCRQILGLCAELRDYKAMEEHYASFAATMRDDLGEGLEPQTVAYYEQLMASRR